MPKPTYKSVKIIRASSGDWRVVYEYEYPHATGVYKKFYVRDGINYIHDPQEKEAAAQQLKKDIEVALQDGFNPFTPEMEIQLQSENEEREIELIEEGRRIKFWTIAQAIDNFLTFCKHKNLSDNTIKKYTSQNGRLKAWLEEKGLSDKPAFEVDEDILLDFLEDGTEEHTWSPRTYNNYIDYIATLFTRIEKLERRKNKAVKYMMDVSFLEEKTTRAERNRYYTPQVAEIIKKEIKKDKELYNYVQWIFYSCMRPKEIRLLQVQHIDLSARQIKVTAPTGKTGDRFVPISDELMGLITSMNLNEVPLNYFVFGAGKKSSSVMIPDDYFRDKYRPYKTKLGLEKNYTLYSWKHTRVVSLLMAGFDDNQVMTLTGHRDRAGFDAYKRELVIDNSSMKGKTIDF